MRSVQKEGAKLVLTYQYEKERFQPPLEELLNSDWGHREALLNAGKRVLLDELLEAFSNWRSDLRPFPTSRAFFTRDGDELLRKRLEALGYIE